MNSGILLLDKQKGISSAKAIAEVKHKLKLKKIGHAGTLDPMATGLLVCLLNSATRLASYAEAGFKTYSGVIKLGLSSDTDDICGNILSESKTFPTDNDLQRGVNSLTGEIEQRPPSVSAIKVNGVRSYQHAREGRSLVLQSRRVTVESFQISRLSESDISFVIRCSKGTYIRSLARDLGNMLSCGGLLAELRREASAPFTVDQALTIQKVNHEHILGWDTLFSKCSKVMFNDTEANKLFNGESKVLQSRSDLIEAAAGGDSRASKLLYADSSGQSLGLLLKQPDGWRIGVNISKPGLKEVFG